MTDRGSIYVKLWTPFCSRKRALCQCFYTVLWPSLKNVTPCWNANSLVDYSIDFTAETNKPSDMKSSFLREQMHFTGFCLWITLQTTAKEEVDGKVWKKHMEQIKQSPNARGLEENSSRKPLGLYDLLCIKVYHTKQEFRVICWQWNIWDQEHPSLLTYRSWDPTKASLPVEPREKYLSRKGIKKAEKLI